MNNHIRQRFIMIGPLTYLTHIAVHYRSYTVHQISLWQCPITTKSIYNLLAIHLCISKKLFISSGYIYIYIYIPSCI